MRKIVPNCSKILAGVLLTTLLAACGSKEGETTAISSQNPQVFYSHSVAMSSDSVYSWGVNTYGQLGHDGITAKSTPKPVTIEADDGTPIAINGVSAGGTHTLAFGVAADPVYAWGNNGFGQLGNNSTTASTKPVKVRIDSTADPAFLTGITAVAAGWDHSLALKSGAVWAWGNNRQGQLGLGDVTPEINQRSFAVPAISPVNANVTMIAAGGSYNLALSSDKTVRSWGYNKSGQLGQGLDTHKIPTPGKVVTAAGGSELPNVIHIAAGGSHSLFVDGDHKVWACGLNNFGQLGDGSFKKEFVAVPVLKDKDSDEQLTGAIAVAAGLGHSLALIDGNVWAWGNNDSGQLGDNSTTTRTTPVQVLTNETGHPPLDNIIKIVAIGNHSFALESGGHLWAWGENTYGQLGNGKKIDSPYAIEVTGISNPGL